MAMGMGMLVAKTRRTRLRLLAREPATNPCRTRTAHRRTTSSPGGAKKKRSEVGVGEAVGGGV